MDLGLLEAEVPQPPGRPGQEPEAGVLQVLLLLSLLRPVLLLLRPAIVAVDGVHRLVDQLLALLARAPQGRPVRRLQELDDPLQRLVREVQELEAGASICNRGGCCQAVFVDVGVGICWGGGGGAAPCAHLLLP